MNISESIINNLLMEVDSLTYRLRNIKQCYKASSNIRLRERLMYESRTINERVSQINKVGMSIKNINKDEISFTSLLIEKTKRTLIESKTESNLFFL